MKREAVGIIDRPSSPASVVPLMEKCTRPDPQNSNRTSFRSTQGCTIQENTNALFLPVLMDVSQGGRGAPVEESAARIRHPPLRQATAVERLDDRDLVAAPAPAYRVPSSPQARSCCIAGLYVRAHGRRKDGKPSAWRLCCEHWSSINGRVRSVA
jgi:hypothetical protein